MKKTFDEKIASAIKFLQDNWRFDFDYCTHYGEPGYGPAERGVLLANWNNVPKGLVNWLERTCGFDIEWSDEWTIDNDKAYRTQADSYGWQSSIVHTVDGDLLTPDDDASDVIECLAMTDWNQPTAALPRFIDRQDLIDAGYELQADHLEHGFHPGQTDDPTVHAKQQFERGASRVVFFIDGVGQFDVHFECWALFEHEEATCD